MIHVSNDNGFEHTMEKDTLSTCLGEFFCKDCVAYPNGGSSRFYVQEDKKIAIIVDVDICRVESEEDRFAYRSITGKQNEYMQAYQKVFRVLAEDLKDIDSLLMGTEEGDCLTTGQADRMNLAESSPLEWKFEEAFTDVYGSDSARFLWKEYGITDTRGHTRFLDYYVRTSKGEIAVEENGVNYHHPQLIGLERYRDQLNKQNLCTSRNIKLFRFSTEDLAYENRMEDDIQSFFGKDTSGFVERGILADRPVVLYEHQKDTLEEMARQRADGIRSFLIVFPTASGKSKIIEEDMAVFAKDHTGFKALILVPNKVVRQDWKMRVHSSLSACEADITVATYAYMELHYTEYAQEFFSYIVVDEAHHAVAPGLKRTIQYYQPQWLVGITATDERPDKRRLESVFGTYQVGLSLQEAMAQGIVARANAYRIETNIDLSHVRINGKDYVNADLEKSIRVTSRNELIVQVLQQYFLDGEAGNRQGVIFCVNIEHTLEMQRLLCEAGITAVSYTRKSKHPEQIMQDFKDHKIRFLCSCQMISEGWDYPELGILVMARPTLSKVLYLQQLGRGLRRTPVKQNVFVIDVVDEYSSMAQPCSLHSIFQNPYYVPFGDITERHYQVGDMIVVDGIQERIERITEIDTQSFDEKYGNYLSEEQLAREFFLNTGTVRSWIKKGKITPSVTFPFGSKSIYMFSPENVEIIREQEHIPVHSDDTIKDDFFAFLEERDYALSYKMVFLTGFIQHMDASGDAQIDDVLKTYTAFYRDRLAQGLPADRRTCPFTLDNLEDQKFVKQNMLRNPFEKFERKRFMYYSKDLNILSLNHALHARLQEDDYQRILRQMQDDLNDYYSKLV